MPRLNLNDEGNSFLDLRFIQSAENFGVEITLRLPAVHGRSVVVFHDIITWNKDLWAAHEFFNSIISQKSWKCKLTDKCGFFSICWNYDIKNALFSASWRDEYGNIDYHTYVSTETAGRFQEAVRVTKQSLLGY